MNSEIKPTDELTSHSAEAAPKESAVTRMREAMFAPQTVAATPEPNKTSDEMAVMRTLMAADRTLMAWVRTSLSLLSFGFTIYKILQEFHEVAGRVSLRPNVPRNVGLFLAAMGTLAMVMGTIEYLNSLKALHQQRIFLSPRAPMIMAVLMSLTGVSLFFGIIAKVF